MKGGDYMKKVYCINKTKKFIVADNEKIISKHCCFYHAQKGVERHLKAQKISNNYNIISL